MQCNKCSYSLDKQMNYCPICGHQTGKSVEITNAYANKQLIEKLYAESEYDQILDLAIAGDNIAKYYYIEYIHGQADKGQFYNWDSIFEKLITEKNNNQCFAIAAYGIFLYRHAEKGALGVSDTDTMERAYKLVEKASNMYEPAAMTEFGIWCCDGTSYISKDEYRGYQLIKAAADMGYPHALRILGYWYYKGGRNISVDENRGFELIEKAAFMGEHSARHIILQENPNWLDENISFSISTKTVEHIVQLLDYPKIQNNTIVEKDTEKQSRKTDAFSLLEKCRSIDDYKSLHKHLKEHSNINQKEIQPILSFIEMVISSIVGIPITSETIANAEKTKADVDKAKELLNRYTCPQHFLHFKEDLKRLNLSFDEPIMSDLMTYASNLLNSKCEKEYQAYDEFLKTKDFVKSSKGCLVVMIVGIILTFALTNVIVGAIAVLVFLYIMFVRKSNKKKLADIKQDFLLINSLFGYGYKIGKINEYHKDMPYTNYVGSVLNGQK